MALGTADVRASTPCEAQQRAAPVFAGRQSDEDEDKRRVPLSFYFLQRWLRKLSAFGHMCWSKRATCVQSVLG